MPSSSDKITLELDDIRLVISPRIGASIASLLLRGHLGTWVPLLRDMPSDAQNPSEAASFLMLPWTNRVKDARFSFDDRTYPLNANHPDANAIHGIGRDRRWSIVDRSPIHARLTLDASDDPDAPYPFGGVVRYEIGPDLVEIDLSITNLGQSPIPVGCGHHPYFHRHLHSDADQLRVQLDVSGRYVCDSCIPNGEIIDDEICATLRSGGPIGNPGLDDVFVNPSAQALLEWPQSGVRLRMSGSNELGHVVVYSPREPDGSAGEFVCIEPVSMVNNGFNMHAQGATGTGVVVLDPGHTMRTRTLLEFSSM